MEKIMVQIAVPGLTAAQYDKAWEDIREAGHENPKGMLHHFAGVSGTNWLIIEIWESEEDFNEFGKILMPILERNAVPQTMRTVLSLYKSFNW